MTTIDHPARADAAAPDQDQGTGAQLALERFLPYRLSVLSNRISSAIAREYSLRFNLSVTEWRVMAVLGRYPGLSAREVAERTAMDKVAVSRAVARLIDAGRLERESDDDDRRRSVLRLSAAGYAVHEAVAPLALSVECHLLEGMPEDERRLLFRLLDRLEELEIRAGPDAPLAQAQARPAPPGQPGD